MRYPGNKKGQAIAELAIFGALILLVSGALLVYIQQLNDVQYGSMENFRRTMKLAYEYTPMGPSPDPDAPVPERTGAVVHHSFVENRRVIDIDAPYRKDQQSQNIATADVFWAVPTEYAAEGEKSKKPDELATQLVYYRINQDDVQLKDGDKATAVTYTSDLIFTEDSAAGGEGQYTDSTVSENVTTRLEGLPIEKKQKIYEDEEGQFKYKKDGSGTVGVKEGW